MRVDAHHHFIELDRFDYPWLGPELQALQRDFTLDDLQPLLQQHHFDCSVLVQTISSIKETEYFLDIANADNPVAGVIGWVDLCANDLNEQLSQLQSRGPLLGIRHQVHDETDDQWLLRPDVMRGLRILEQHQLPYELLIKPQHLSVSLQVARELPELPLIIDHIAKPSISSTRVPPAWTEGMQALADCPQVWCKLSGMLTEADWQQWQPADVFPFIESVVQSFGCERLLFGSDWPVCLLAGSYDDVIHTLETALQELLSAGEQERIFGYNAVDCYRLQRT